MPNPNTILRFDGTHFETYPFNDYAKGRRRFVTHVSSDSMDRLWYNMLDEIVVYDTKKLTSKKINYNSLIDQDTLGAIMMQEHVRENLHCVITTRGVGWLKHDERLEFIGLDRAPLPRQKPGYCIAKINRNILLIGSAGGFYTWHLDRSPLDSMAYTFHKVRDQADKEVVIRSMERISDEIVAILVLNEAYEYSVLFYDVKSNRYHTPNLPFSLNSDPNLSPYFDQLLWDSQAHLWISGFGQPLIKCSLGRTFDFLKDSITLDQLSVFEEDRLNPHALQSKYVRSITEDRDQNIWIATNEGLQLYKSELNAVSKIEFPAIYQDRRIHQIIMVDSIYWIANSGTLLYYHPGKATFGEINQENTSGPIPEKIYYIKKDSLNNIWAGSEYGLFVISRKTQNRFSSERVPLRAEKLSRNAIFQFKEDRRGNFYFHLTYGELYKFNPYSKEYWRLEVVEKSNMVFSHIICHNNELWSSTALGGLWRLKEKKTSIHKELITAKKFPLQNDIHHFTTMSNNSIMGFSVYGNTIVELNTSDFIEEKFYHTNPEKTYRILDVIYHHGKFWLNSNTGLLCWDTTALRFTPVLPDIIKPNFYRPTTLSTNQGKLLIPGMGCFYILDTDRYGTPDLGKPRFSSIRINGNEPLSIQHDGQHRYTIPDLQYDDSDINILLATDNLYTPDHIIFQYRVAGIHDNWVKANKQHTLHLTRMPPGKHSISLRSSLDGKTWNEEPSILSFRVRPPWYWSPASKLTYTALLLGILYFIYRFQLKRKLAENEARRLAELDHVKSQLYTNITHEFRTPLTVIEGMADRIKASLPPKSSAEIAQSLHLIERNSKSLLSLVNQLLDLAKADQGALELRLKQVDVIPFVHYVLESFHSMADDKSIQLTCYAEVDAQWMDVDDDKLLIILSNLITNAIKFTDAGGKVILHARRLDTTKENQFVIKIKDTGKGISTENLPFIFDRFYQVNNDIDRPQDGSGIGLALTKKLVELMHGTIKVESEVGKGSTFTVSLPITNNAERILPQKAPQTNQAYQLKQEWSPDSSTSSIDAPLVLIVEDNEDVATYITYCLQHRYQILIANHGMDGWTKAITHSPSLIITDVMMPIMDGIALCNKLKTDVRTDHIPVIMLTAKVTDQDRISGLEAGADAYLHKPFKKEELEARIEQLILNRKRLIEKFSVTPYAQLIKTKAEDRETKFVQRAYQIIYDHLNDHTFGPDLLARELGLSKSQTYRKLKSITDKSTALFIRSVKLQHAKEMLHTTDCTVSEVAHSSGFDDVSYFSRVFKQEFGVTPGSLKS